MAAPAAGEPRRIAVIGSGITGLSCAWLLHRSGARVTLYESEPTCGGHTLTDTTSPWPVDLGFQVYNLTTYPHLVGFLDALGVDTEPSDMSFALSMDGGALEWASHDLGTIFVQRRNLLSPSFLRMVWDVVRFGREAPEVLRPDRAHLYRGVTLGEYLQRNGYSQGFRDNYVLPMCAAVWSVPNATVLAFPVQMLVRFWANHHLLDLFQRPCWRVVKGRGRAYVERVLRELPDVRTSSPVASVTRVRGGNGVDVLVQGARAAERYDAAVLATHSDVSLKLLGAGASDAEREVLAAVPYNSNHVYLHTDATLMPQDRRAWASWNFLGESGNGSSGGGNGSSGGSGSDDAAVTVSYWLNRLQHLPAEAPQMFVTLNPPRPPAADKTLRRLQLAHPVYSFESYAAQARLPSIQGSGGVFFCGAWAGYGFHEDGIRAAVGVAKMLGAAVPWGDGVATSPKLGLGDMFWLALFDRFARAAITAGQLRLILPNGEERRYGGPPESAAPPVAPGEEWRGLPPRRATVRVLRMEMFRKVVQRTDVGLGEAYMDGDYLVDDLGAFMALMVANARSLEGQKGLLGAAQWLNERLLAAAHARRSNTRAGSRRNIEEHYDAGNAMYAAFLDRTMTYSCGVHTAAQEGDLEAAQLAKLDAVIAAAGIKPGDHVLEIGCGWGSFAMRAASTAGCRVTGLTLSKEQLAEATARVAAAGLSDKVTLLFCDYRDCPNLGTYDRVVSIEMIEAVGHEHLESYFATIDAALKPGGTAVIQVIAQPDERYASYCASSDFIREHVFPGGHLPSMGAMVEACQQAGTSLRVSAVRDIGPDYAVTLRAWREAWGARRQHIVRELGYSERFWLKYDFYFAYCEAAFDARYIHDFHVTFVKGLAAGGDDGLAGQQPRACASCGRSGGSSAAAVATVAGGGGGGGTPQAVLLAIYMFLAGLLVSRRPLLWAMPLASTAFAALGGAAGAGAGLLSPGYNALSPAGRARWRALVCHLVFSAVAAAAALALVAAHPRALLPQPAPAGADAVAAAAAKAAAPLARAWASAAASPAIAALAGGALEAAAPLRGAADSLVAVAAARGGPLGRALAGGVEERAALVTTSAAGYFAFRLWLLARGSGGGNGGGGGALRLLLPLLQYTALLIVYGAASYRAVQLPLLAAALASELASVPRALRHLRELHRAGADGGGGAGGGGLLLAAERLAFLLARAAPQALLLWLVAASPGAFRSRATYCLAAAGMAFAQLVNLLRARELFLLGGDADGGNGDGAAGVSGGSADAAAAATAAAIRAAQAKAKAAVAQGVGGSSSTSA